MTDKFDILAHLLAAEDHPHLKDKPEFQDAYRQLEESASLQARFAEAKAFVDAHPTLVGMDRMPQDARDRIGQALRREMGGPSVTQQVQKQLSPWTVRTQFAWAAVLVLLLAGMAVMSSSIIENQTEKKQLVVQRSLPPQAAFRLFVQDTIQHRLPLQERDSDIGHLVDWLRDQGAGDFTLPDALTEREGLGCGYLDGPHGKIALICFGGDNQIVHLFISPTAPLNFNQPSPPEPLVIDQREAMQWNDMRNTYLLVAHQPGQPLPPFLVAPTPTGASDPESQSLGEISLL